MVSIQVNKSSFLKPQRYPFEEKTKLNRRIKTELSEKYGEASGYTVIYALCDPHEPPNRDIRYIGKAEITDSKNDLNKRSNKHINEADRRERHSQLWLIKLFQKKCLPNLAILAIIKTENWVEAEVKFIAAGRRFGYDLTNETDGGEGMSGIKRTEEEKKHLSEILTGKKVSAKTRALMSKNRKGGGAGRKQSLEEIEKRASKLRGMKRSPEACKAISKGRLSAKIKISKEHREKISRANIGRKMSKKAINAISKANKGRPCKKSTREKISEAHKGKRLSKEHRKKISHAHSGKKLTEEHKKAIGKASRLSWRKPGFRVKIQRMNQSMMKTAARLCIKGFSFQVIGKKLGVSRSTIIYALSGIGYYLPMLKKLKTEQRTQLRVELKKRKSSNQRGLSNSQVKKAKKLRIKKWSYQRIANQFKVATSTVGRALRYEGTYTCV